MSHELITPTTELEAVNAILASVGESPVQSLDGDFVDAELAQNLLTQVSRQVQVQGWSFNTEYDFPLTPKTNGEIELPSNTLKVTIAGEPQLVMRGSKLYDSANRTYVFTEAKQATLVIALLFEELPEALRQFLFMRAGRRFQDRLEGDQVLNRFYQSDEMAAWAAFQNYEAEVQQLNVIRQSTTISRIKGSPR